VALVPSLQGFIHRGYDSRFTTLQTDRTEFQIRLFRFKRFSELRAFRHMALCMLSLGNHDCVTEWLGRCCFCLDEIKQSWICGNR
jgi:hypothetical protein